MIVLDASAAIEFLLGTDLGARVRERIEGTSLHAPHLIDPEVVQVIRRKATSREVSQARAAGALQDLADLRLRRYSHQPLIPRAWELRNTLTAYDAMYIALAELLDAPVLTTDSRLARARGPTASVEVLRSENPPTA